MLRTNSKRAVENIRLYITLYAWDELLEREKWDFSEEQRAANVLDIFESEKPISDVNAFRRGMSRYDVFREWAQGLAMGDLFGYYYNRLARKDVQTILEESDEEAERYTEEQAQELLTRLIFRELNRLARKVS